MDLNSGITENASVMRIDGTGVKGVVVSLTEDTTGKGDSSERGVIVGVQWDNGTMSYLTPDALKVLH